MMPFQKQNQGGPSRQRTPVPVAQTLRALFKNLGIERVIERHSIWTDWKEIVGTEVASHTEPQFFSGTCLFVTVDHPGWLHQLTFLKDQIVSKINTKLGSSSVTEIRFRVGSLNPPQAEPVDSIQHRPSLSNAEREIVEELVASVSSHELQETLRRVIGKDLISKKSLPDRSAP